jgi:hypothetical protein
MDIFTNRVIVATTPKLGCWGYALRAHPQQPSFGARRLEAALQPVYFWGYSPWISMQRKADFIHKPSPNSCPSFEFT